MTPSFKVLEKKALILHCVRFHTGRECYVKYTVLQYKWSKSLQPASKLESHKATPLQTVLKSSHTTYMYQHPFTHDHPSLLYKTSIIFTCIEMYNTLYRNSLLFRPENFRAKIFVSNNFHPDRPPSIYPFKNIHCIIIFV